MTIYIVIDVAMDGETGETTCNACPFIDLKEALAYFGSLVEYGGLRPVGGSGQIDVTKGGFYARGNKYETHYLQIQEREIMRYSAQNVREMEFYA